MKNWWTILTIFFYQNKDPSLAHKIENPLWHKCPSSLSVILPLSDPKWNPRDWISFWTLASLPPSAPVIDFPILHSAPSTYLRSPVLPANSPSLLSNNFSLFPLWSLLCPVDPPICRSSSRLFASCSPTARLGSRSEVSLLGVLLFLWILLPSWACSI